MKIFFVSFENLWQDEQKKGKIRRADKCKEKVQLTGKIMVDVGYTKFFNLRWTELFSVNSILFDQNDLPT